MQENAQFVFQGGSGYSWDISAYMAEWEEFTDETPEDFVERMTDGLPAGTKLFVQFEFGQLSNIEYSYDGDLGKFSFTRSFKGKGVKHEDAYINGDFEGWDINKKIQSRLFNLYQAKGYEDVKVTAGWVGRYTWASLGFVPNKKDWDKIREQMRQRLDFLEGNPEPEGRPIPAVVSDAIRLALVDEDPKAMWFIVDQKYEVWGKKLGKMLTLDWRPEELPDHFPVYEALMSGNEKVLMNGPHGWAGRLDLKDPQSMDRVKRYLREFYIAPAVMPTTKPKTGANHARS